MTLEEAIQHLKESLADPTHKWGCEECKEEHEQLLKWLVDLRELTQKHIETVEGMKELERRYSDATALLEIALHDIERFANCKSPTKCIDLVRLRSVSFMGGVIELPNVWRYADEANELIHQGKVNDMYNSCQICGKQISPYKQTCHECEIKYKIRWGDSITQKLQEYIRNLERGEKNGS